MITVEQHQKKLLVLRHQLIGAGFHNALTCLELARMYHKGYRKDSSPEFDHQVSIALFIRSLPDLMYREETVCATLWHDLREDYNLSNEELRENLNFAPKEFVERVINAVEALTKVFRGDKKDPKFVFTEIAHDPIASIVKGADRIHNFQTMVGVFKLEKQKEYIGEANEYFFPMLKTARRQFPHQVNAYELIKHMLKSQIELIEAMHTALEKDQN